MLTNQYKINHSIRLYQLIQNRLNDKAVVGKERKIYEAKEKNVRAQLADLITDEELDNLLNSKS